MKVLIIYATNSGSTEICSKIIKEELEKFKHNVTMIKALDTNFNNLSGMDLVLFGSPSWDYAGKEGMPHEDMVALLEKFKDASFAGNTRYVVFGCGDKSYAYFCHAVNVIEDFLKSRNIKTSMESLKVDSFFFDMDKNISQVETWANKLSKLTI